VVVPGQRVSFHLALLGWMGSIIPSSKERGNETAEHSYCNVVNMLSSDVTNTFAEVVDMIKQ
jgi:hypothetical protein